MTATTQCTAPAQAGSRFLGIGVYGPARVEESVVPMVAVGPAETPGTVPVLRVSGGKRHGLVAHGRSRSAARGSFAACPVPREAGTGVFGCGRRSVPVVSGIRPTRQAPTPPIQPGSCLAAAARIEGLAAQTLGTAPHTTAAMNVVGSGNTSTACKRSALDSLPSQSARPSGGQTLLAGSDAGPAHAAQVVTLP